ncbi:MAG: hypothetical protein ACKO7P_09775 [Bacteroidota bacterium]
MQDNLIISLNHNGKTFFNSKKYSVKINGDSIGEINKTNFKLSHALTPGTHIIEVTENKYSKTIYFKVSDDKLNIITVKPQLTYKSILAFYISFSVVALFLNLYSIDFKSISTYGFLGMVPFIFLSSDKFSKSFDLVIRK